MERAGASDMSVGALRIRVRALASRFSGLLEAMADDISARAGDVKTRHAMTQFKINGIPAMQAALFQPDPVAALLDGWVLLAQLQQVLPKLQREELAEPLKAVARQQFADMEAEVEQLWRELTGRPDTSDARRRVHRWAAEHPLAKTLAARESTASLLADLTARSNVGLLGATAALIQDTQDLTARLDVQAAWLPKQVRWQGEYLLLEALTDPSTGAAVREDIGGLLGAVERVTRVMETMPAVLARERQAALSALHQERLETQDYVTSEREALLGALRAERVAALADVDRMGSAWVDQAFDRAARLMDRAFLWLLALVGVLVLGGLVALLLVLSAWKRRAPGGRQPWLPTPSPKPA